MLRIDTTPHATQNLDSDHKEKIMFESNLSNEVSHKRYVPSEGRDRIPFLSSHNATRALCCFLAALMTVTGIGSAWAAVPFGSANDVIDTAEMVIVGPNTAATAMVFSLDTDGDGMPDVLDNCSRVPNAGALSCDSDMDGYGNACDADFNNDGVSDGTDFASPHFIADFWTGIQSDNAAGNEQGTDMNCDGSVDGLDFASPYFLAGFSAGTPGPSGLACAGTELCASGVVRGAAFESPGALYTGQYAYVPFHISRNWPVDFDDFVFEVVEGDGAGKISYSKDATFDPKNPTVMLLAGTVPGSDYTLRALYDGVEVASTKFSVTTDWNHEGQGPPRWMEGPSGNPAPAGSTFGGGPVGPQNLGTKPIPEDWEIAVVLVSFDDRPFADGPTDLTGWEDAINGASDSLNAYYDEVSNGQFSITATGFGPVAIDGNWQAVHTQQSSGVWRPDDAFYENCATAADVAHDDFNPADFDTLLCVSATDTTLVPAQFTWPYGSSARNISTTDGDFTIGTISMPDLWELVDGRARHATLAHEMGHNLGVGDQYTPLVPASDMPSGQRNLAGWEIMAWETEIPHVTLPLRMMWGLIDEADIRSFNPVEDDEGLSEGVTVRLTAVEKMVVAAGDDALGVEFRINDGRNYTFEYRHGQAGHTGDQGTTVPGPGDAVGAVLGVDVISEVIGAELDEDRPNLLHLPGGTDLSAEGLIWYQDEAGTDNRLEVEVTDIDANSVELMFTYGVPAPGAWDGASPAPDLKIRPWPSETHNWQSPDIEISNADSLADPDYENVAVAGTANTITATVENIGDLDATDVEVSFYVKDQNVGAAVPKTKLGSTVADVAAGTSADFIYSGWVPPDDGHFCVVAEIEPFPGEMSTDNNDAQSNYDVVESGSASPAARIIRDVMVSNPYDLPTWFQLVVDQDGEAFRTYLEATEVLLEAGETRKMRVMFEYTQSAQDLLRRETNTVSLTGWIYDPRPTPAGDLADSPEKAGGVDFLVVNGFRTQVGNLETEVSLTGVTVRGDIQQVGTGALVDGGQVVATTVSRMGKIEHPPIAVAEDGTFEVTFPSDTTAVKVRFVPKRGLKQVQRSESDWIVSW